MSRPQQLAELGESQLMQVHGGLDLLRKLRDQIEETREKLRKALGRGRRVIPPLNSPWAFY